MRRRAISEDMCSHYSYIQDTSLWMWTINTGKPDLSKKSELNCEACNVNIAINIRPCRIFFNHSYHRVTIGFKYKDWDGLLSLCPTATSELMWMYCMIVFFMPSKTTRFGASRIHSSFYLNKSSWTTSCKTDWSDSPSYFTASLIQVLHFVAGLLLLLMLLWLLSGI